METKTEDKCGPTRRKSTTKCVKLCAKEERNASLKKVSVILQKVEHERTLEEEQTLSEYSEIVADLKMRWQRRDEAKRRTEEVEEPTDVLQDKCLALAKAIAQSEHLVIYTGAGISTAARIPDYRGTNGIWTRIQQGKDIGNHDLSLAEPTFTHMALSELYSRKVLKYVVSQNCDGLHLRSGLPRSALSELHGNMYMEVCKSCKPAREYWRLFDVTENTARYSHKTMRRCYVCSQELVDTIVHFGERGTLQWPLNWSGACKNADKADTIICLGSSLKVLKRYPWLWQMNKPAKKRPNLYIINLQWTPKDEHAILKINGKCDNIMKMVMKYLGVDVPGYSREKDPIFAHATLLLESEMHTTTQPFLKGNENNESDECKDNVLKTIKQESIEGNDMSSNKCVIENIKSEVNNDNETIIKEESGKDLIQKNIIEISNPLTQNNIYYEEQSEAIDFSKHKNTNDTLNNSIDCDRNTHSSIKASRLTLTNGSSSSNCTLSENNSHTKRKSQDYCIENVSPPSKASNTSIFSIDSILNKNDTVSLVKNEYERKNEQRLQIYEANRQTVNNLGNFQAIMAYYELANTVLQNQMLGYSCYPLQTSFLYPGLHSIINPVPYINYDFNCASPMNSIPNITSPNSFIKKEPELPKAPTCAFCNKIFSSLTCLYYSSTECKFIKEFYRFSKSKNCKRLLVCVCCDYSTDEDDEDSDDASENKNKKKIVKKDTKCENDINDDLKEEDVNVECISENIDQTNIENKKIDGKIVKIQAGWFGKGCRKNRRIKKR